VKIILKQIMTPAERGRLGGLSNSPAKRRAAKRNGKLGGRPKAIGSCGK
jgi:hypothetical protein